MIVHLTQLIKKINTQDLAFNDVIYWSIDEKNNILSKTENGFTFIKKINDNLFEIFFWEHKIKNPKRWLRTKNSIKYYGNTLRTLNMQKCKTNIIYLLTEFKKLNHFNNIYYNKENVYD